MGHPCRHPGYKLNNPKTQQLNPGSQETANDTDGRVWKGTIDQSRRGQAENVTGTRTKFGETDALLKASCRKVLRVKKKNQKTKTTKNKTKNKTNTSFAPRGQKNSHSELKNTEFPSTSNQGQEREPFQGVQVLLLSIGAYRRTYSTRANGFINQGEGKHPIIATPSRLPHLRKKGDKENFVKITASLKAKT